MDKLLVLVLVGVSFIGIGCTKIEQKQPPQVQQKYENLNNAIDVDDIGNKVILRTSMGEVIFEMQRQAAPNTVNNFLRYVISGFYDGTIFHRVMPEFMIQGGGFNTQIQEKRTYPPVKNEFKISNTRGTVAMAKLDGDPDSATSQFFINLVDNSSNLDNQNGGFTVFGKVIGGMDVVDRIAFVNTTYRNGMSNIPAEPVIIISAEVVSQ